MSEIEKKYVLTISVPAKRSQLNENIFNAHTVMLELYEMEWKCISKIEAQAIVRSRT